MEQNILPKNIKIAILLMITNGILLFCFTIYLGWSFWAELSKIGSGQYVIFSFILNNLEVLLIPILLILFAYFLKKNKKWAWFAAIVLLSKEIVAGIPSIPLFFSGFSYLKESQTVIPAQIFTLSVAAAIVSAISFIFALASLILLIIERKNISK